MGEKCGIVLVDDHPLFREGMKFLIADNPRYEVLAEAGSAEEALTYVREIKPEIVVMDVCLPDKSGIQISRDIHRIASDCKILIVSMYSKLDQITEAFRAGVLGYVLKESVADRLLQGLDAVSRGEYFFDHIVSRKMVQRILDIPQEEERIADSQYKKLTPREKQVLRFLAEGLSTKEVADRLYISPKTAENHRANVMKKLDLQNTVDLIRYAVKLGIIDTAMWSE